MFSSLKLGRLFGIKVYIHTTFWLLPLFVLLSGLSSGNLFEAAFNVAVLFSIFGCVVLHEVGHALAARYYGIGTRDITLYPVGGVASLRRMPERPVQEIVIALAGPAVNLVIAVGLFLGLFVSGNVLPASLSSSEFSLAGLFVARLLMANVFLLLFNLLPAFPMDGGRVLRAVLSFGMPRVRATETAVGVGGVVAVGFVIVGLFGIPALGISGGNISLILVAVVVFMLGRAELAGVQAQAAHRTPQQRPMDRYAHEPDPNDPQGREFFTGWTWDPICKVWRQWHNGVLVREVP